MSRPLAVVVLAAGLGKRTKIGTPKVLLPLCGRTLLATILDEVAQLAPVQTVVVVHHGREQVERAVVLGVGPVTGVFDAEVGLFDLDEPRSAVLKGRLSGSLGAASGTGRLTLVPQGQDCRIDHQYDIHLSGRVAMIGGRMLDGAARQLINAFLRRFAMSLEPAKGNAAATPWHRRWRGWFGASR